MFWFLEGLVWINGRVLPLGGGWVGGGVWGFEVGLSVVLMGNGF